MSESKKVDLIWGAKAIADELNVPPRKAFYLLETGAIPALKVRSMWVVERRKLREFFARGDIKAA